jgi:hypothetical protein
MKKLDTDSITNELARSSFFPGRPAETREERPKVAAPQPAPVETAKPIIQPPIVTPAPRTVTKLPAVPVAAPASRRYIRRTFDFYEDQISYLNKASLEDRLAGGDMSMNAMVRDAIDSYIANRQKK